MPPVPRWSRSRRRRRRPSSARRGATARSRWWLRRASRRSRWRPICAPRCTIPSIDVDHGRASNRGSRQATGTSLQFVNMFLMTFAIVALVVGSFVIYNTFSITVAQRTKETALLRAIGAKRRQVMRSIRLEALFIGLFASAAGVAAGIGLAQGLRSVLKAFGLDLPSGGAVIVPRTIVVSMLTGIIVTLVAAWLPARRAAKVAPIEALRDTAVDSDGALEAPGGVRCPDRSRRCFLHGPRPVGCRRTGRRAGCARSVPRRGHVGPGDRTPVLSDRRLAAPAGSGDVGHAGPRERRCGIRAVRLRRRRHS